MSGSGTWKARSARTGPSISSVDSKPPSNVCWKYALGTCVFGDKCKFSHEGSVVQTRQTLSCKYYFGPNGCERGDRCGFSHDISPDETTPETITFAGAKRPSVFSTPMADLSKPCWAFQRGKCRFGDGCKYSHSPATYCVFFRNGKCTHGASCKYLHNTGTTSEKMPPQPWRRSGASYPEQRDKNQTDQPAWRRNSGASLGEDPEGSNKKWGWKSDRAQSDNTSKAGPDGSVWRRGSVSQEPSQGSGPSDWRRGSVQQEPRTSQNNPSNKQRGRSNFSGRAAYEWEEEDSDSSDDGILEMSVVSAAWGTGKQPATDSASTKIASEVPSAVRSKGQSVFANWRNQLRLTSRGTSDSAELRSFWENAIEVFEDPDPTLRQKLIELLLQRGDHGKKRIAQVTQTSPGKNGDIVENSYPFLVFATLPQLVESPTMEYHAGSLYKMVYDSDEKRCRVFFEELASQLAQDQPTSVLQSRSSEKNAEAGIHVQALVKVAEFLRQLLKWNTGARFNDGLVKVVKSMLVFVSQYVESQDMHVRQARATLRAVEDICHNPTETLNTISTFINDRDLAGHLSSEGPRHDNDHARIEDIKILPTLDEIQSERNDFLPRRDQIDKRFLEGAKRLADTNFRLLRYDYVKVIRDIVSVVLRQLKLPERDREKALTSPCPNNLRYYLYRDAELSSRLQFSQVSGMQFALKFDHPQELRKKTNDARQKWWDAKKRLERGTLICLVTSNDSEQDIHFLMIAEKETDPEVSITLSGEECAIVQPAEPTDAASVKKLLEYTNLSHDGNITVLIEFPKCLPETFIPVLSTLKDLSVTGSIPFEQFMARDSSEIRTILPPAYAREPGFEFNLDPVMVRESSDHPTLSPGTSSDNTAIITYLEENTSLDHGQCKGLIAALTQEVSLLQGPPGTGKSYLGLQIVRILLDSCPLEDIGPIVCVCYTNHALDQFLEELLDEGITEIVRIGGRSSSERLAEKNLRNVSRNFGYGCYSEEQSKLQEELSRHSESLTELSQSIKDINEGLAGDPSCWNSLRSILEYYYPNVFNEFSPQGRKSAVERHSPEERFSNWCSWKDKSPSQRSPRYSIDAILKRPSILNATEYERRQLIDQWVSLFTDKAPDLLEQFAGQYQELIVEYQSLKRNSDHKALSSARIIGVTTTGLAKNINLLRGLTAKVVLCEEAGEVLEGHLLNSILPSCEHLILIGDHEQLRPQINQALELSMEFFRGIHYRLDESLFERLVYEDNNISPSQLGVQRRMRPNIADLVRETIYPELKDHPSVRKYPNVSGMQKNVFWLDHSHKEAGIEDGSSSKSNDWEVDIICGLVQHLIRQGCYRAGDIAVLTPYLGQLQKLRRKLGEVVELSISDRDEEAVALQGLADGDDADSEDADSHPTASQKKVQTAEPTPLNKVVRLATVDNFQGEEAKIIIVSFVRSNERRKIGFLKTKNRANVLLSRAKHGMYIIGNAQTAINSEIWSDVCGILRQRSSLGPKLYLACPRHLDEPFAVTEPDDFIRYAPEGGCILPCDRPLQCGHMCYTKCHANQIHDAVSCREPCIKRHGGCNHPCPKACNQDCGKCEVVIEKHQLQCGHTLENIPCHRIPNSKTEGIKAWNMQQALFKLCQEPCTRIHKGCNHLCTKRCGKMCDPCEVVRENVELPCGHVMETVPCHKVPNSATRTTTSAQMLKALLDSCNKPCTKLHKGCNHPCPKKCGKMCDPCEVVRENVELPCGHVMDTAPCYLALDPARLECKAVVENVELRCGHSLKKVKCRDLETDKNYDLSTLRTGCKQPCHKVRPGCGHACNKICSEACGRCTVTIKNFELPCGHLIKEAPCHQASEPTKIKCSVIVPKIWPGCTHEEKVKCQVDPSITPCTARCTESLDCGHQCTGICGECFRTPHFETQRVHRQDRVCKAMCGKPLPGCGHNCRSTCHGDTPCKPCSARCQVNCGHSWCTRTCSEMCNPCNKPCRWNCKHLGNCSLLCAEPCNRQVCDKRCDKKLRCGHQCPTVCGEACPARQYCQKCCTEDIGSQLVASGTYRSIDLDKRPVLILSCGHIFTRQTMDASVPLHDVYVYDGNGNCLKVKDIPRDIKVPQCPKCSQPLRQFSVRRYGRVINAAVFVQQLYSYATEYEASLYKVEVILDRKISDSGDVRIVSAPQKQLSRGNSNRRHAAAILHTRRLIRSEFQKLSDDAFPKTPPRQKMRDSLALRWFNGHTSTDTAPSDFDNRISRMDIHPKLLKVKMALARLARLRSLLSQLPEDNDSLASERLDLAKEMIEVLNKASKECQSATEEARIKKSADLEIEGHIALSKLYGIFQRIPADIAESFELPSQLCVDTLEGMRHARKLCDQFGLVDLSPRISEQEVNLELKYK